jgi:hypothetical protein
MINGRHCVLLLSGFLFASVSSNSMAASAKDACRDAFTKSVASELSAAPSTLIRGMDLMAPVQTPGAQGPPSAGPVPASTPNRHGVQGSQSSSATPNPQSQPLQQSSVPGGSRYQFTPLGGGNSVPGPQTVRNDLGIYTQSLYETINFLNDFFSANLYVRDSVNQRAAATGAPEIMHLTQKKDVTGLLLDVTSPNADLNFLLFSFQLDRQLIAPANLRQAIADIFPPLQFRSQSQLVALAPSGEHVTVEIHPVLKPGAVAPSGDLRLIGPTINANGEMRIPLYVADAPYSNSNQHVNFARKVTSSIRGIEFEGLIWLTGTADQFNNYFTWKHEKTYDSGLRYVLILKSKQSLREFLEKQTSIEVIEKLGFDYGVLGKGMTFASHLYIVTALPMAPLSQLNSKGPIIITPLFFNPHP